MKTRTIESVSGEPVELLLPENEEDALEVGTLQITQSYRADDDSTIKKDWVSYEGSRGGRGWQDTITGEVRYQEAKPEPGEASPDAGDEGTVEEAPYAPYLDAPRVGHGFFPPPGTPDSWVPAGPENGDRYQVANLYDWVEDFGLVPMTPDQYLGAIAREWGISQEEAEQFAIPGDADAIRERFKEGLPVDPAWIEYDLERQKMRGQEGRNRAMIAREMDIKDIPVVIVYTVGHKPVDPRTWKPDPPEEVVEDFNARSSRFINIQSPEDFRDAVDLVNLDMGHVSDEEVEEWLDWAKENIAPSWFEDMERNGETDPWWQLTYTIGLLKDGIEEFSQRHEADYNRLVGKTHRRIVDPISPLDNLSLMKMWLAILKEANYVPPQYRYYLQPGEEPPEGVQAQQGPRGGTFVDRRQLGGEASPGEGRAGGYRSEIPEDEIVSPDIVKNIFSREGITSDPKELWDEGWSFAKEMGVSEAWESKRYRGALIADLRLVDSSNSKPWICFNRNSSKILDGVRGQAQEKMYRKALNEVSETLGGWSTSPTYFATTGAWLPAMVLTGNTRSPKSLKEDLEHANEETEDYDDDIYNFSDKGAKAFVALMQVQQEMVRNIDPTYDPETDTVEMWRGVNGDLAANIYNAYMDGEESFDIDHFALESWTAKPIIASAFTSSNAPVVIKARVPVSNIATSFLGASQLYGSEAEYVVMSEPEAATYTRDDIVVFNDFFELDKYIKEATYESAAKWRAAYHKAAGVSLNELIDGVRDTLGNTVKPPNVAEVQKWVEDKYELSSDQAVETAFTITSKWNQPIHDKINDSISPEMKGNIEQYLQRSGLKSAVDKIIPLVAEGASEDDVRRKLEDVFESRDNRGMPPMIIPAPEQMADELAPIVYQAIKEVTE